jgi:hypothetical protein
MKYQLLALFIFCCISCACFDKPNPKTTDTLAVSSKTSADWVFLKTDSCYLRFRDGKSFDTHLYNLTYWGQIKTPNTKAPFFVLSGVDCNECDANIAIYFHSPSNGDLVVEHGQNRYEYPGTLRDLETATLYTKSRAFFGEVLDSTFGIVWYETKLLEKGGYGNFIFLSKIVDDKKIDTLFDDNGKYLTQTLALLKARKCQEIKQEDLKTEP